jgi:hypothetical protein
MIFYFRGTIVGDSFAALFNAFFEFACRHFGIFASPVR